MSVAVLSQNEVLARLEKLSGWNLESGRIVREWQLTDFVAALHFVNAVGKLAEAAGHHPDIDIRYNRALIALVSHDAGGITDNDFHLAEQINLLSY